MEAPTIAARFSERRKEGRAALVPYICAGFPDREASLDLMRAAAVAGADVIELGIPFSDPLADGPTIQAATFESLAKGMTLRGALELLREFRETHDTPVVLFTYLNPVYRFGVAEFVKAAAEAGAQGLLITDLPAGADPSLEDELRSGGLDLIRLLAPTTDSARVPFVSEGASGFLYYISRTGVTGAREEMRTGVAEEVATLRERVDLPIAVGFGVSTPEQAALVAESADGVVVGSALVDIVGREGVEAGGDFLSSLRSAIDSARRV